jgi:hypothetical protein
MLQKFELEFPVELSDGSIVKALALRPVGAAEDEWRLRVLALAYYCNVTPAVIEELDAADFERLSRLLNITANFTKAQPPDAGGSPEKP